MRLPVFDPEQLAEALLDAGWSLAGRREGTYVRLSWPGNSSRSAMVLLDTTAPEYEQMMGSLLVELAEAVVIGRRAGEALAAVGVVGRNG